MFTLPPEKDIRPSLFTPLGKMVHVSILLLPAYRQKLNQYTPIMQTIQCWSNHSDLAQLYCFGTTKLYVFQDNNIDTYTNVVIGYISKFINKVLLRINIQRFPNKKSWEVLGSPCKT